MSDTRIVTERDELRFTWHGGEYVEVAGLDLSTPCPESVAFDVINVYDYEAGRPSIPFTPEALDACVDEWMAEQAEDETDA